MRILFLCNNYHPLSVACLEQLHAAGRFDITVGRAEGIKRGRRSTARELFRRYRLAEVLQRGRRYAIAQTRIKARQAGFVFEGHCTVQEFLHVHRLAVLRVEDINSPGTIDAVRNRGFDLIVAGAFAQILGRKLLAIPRLGAINVHLSLLPKYRGPSPCYWVIQNREQTSGATVHYMDEGIDTGDIMRQIELPLDPAESAWQLEQRLAYAGAGLLLEAIGQIEAGTVRRIPQRREEGSYYSFPNSR